MPVKTKPLQILCSPNDYAMIRELANHNGTSMGAYIRQLIQHAFSHTLCANPTCPDGQRCYVPQMHPPRSPECKLPLPTPSQDAGPPPT